MGGVFTQPGPIPDLGRFERSSQFPAAGPPNRDPVRLFHRSKTTKKIYGADEAIFPACENSLKQAPVINIPDHSEGSGHVGHAKTPAPLESCAWLTRGAFAPDCARAVR